VLYLAGQILAFMLVALVLGAALAWVFLIGPIRRQRPAIAGMGAAAPLPASGRPRGPSLLAAAAHVSVLGGGGRGRATADRAVEETPPTEDAAAAPAGEELTSSDLADLASAQAELADLQPADFVTTDPASAGTAIAPTGPPATEGTAPATVGTAVAADVLVEVDAAGVDEVLVEALTDRLRRQEERTAAENADLASRLAAAELRATASDVRVSAVERQAATAAEQVSATQARIAQVETALRGDDERAGVLRSALAEAEDRAARFSARLAVVRAQAEEATRQTATLTERLERRQVEWKAERAELLLRIGAVEALAVALSTGPMVLPTTTLAAATTATAAGAATTAVAPARGLDASTGAASVAAMDGADDAPADPHAGSAAGETAPVESAPVERAAAESAAVQTAAAESAAAVELAGSDETAGSVEAAPSVGTAGSAAAPAAPAQPTAVGGRQRPQAAPSWGGLAEPVVSTDNLKEIVGIGQVIESRLHGLGITSFRQLAAMGDTDVERLAARLEGFGSRIVSDDWVGQARELQVRYHNGL